MNYKKYTIISLISLVVLLSACKKDATETVKDEDENFDELSQMSEPEFIEEGSLSIIKNNDAEVKIKIEVADDPTEQEIGLMYRTKLPENGGMFFISDREEMKSFWMKNTKIPLDIIYINSNKEIVTIHKNTIPMSKKSLASSKPAIFVLEVNAGFCDKFSIKNGDRIEYKLL